MAFLYEVGPGKTFSTIQSAFDQVYADWGTGDFTGTVTVRVYAGTYAENVTPNTGLNPNGWKNGYVLRLEGDPNASRDSIIVAPAGGTYVLDLNVKAMNVRHLSISGSGASGMALRLYSNCLHGYVSDVKIVHAPGAVTKYGGRLTVRDSYLEATNGNAMAVQCSSGIAVVSRCRMKAYHCIGYIYEGVLRAEASVLETTNAGAGIGVGYPGGDIWNSNLFEIVNCTFYGGHRGVFVGRTDSVRLHNNIFKNQVYPIAVRYWPEDQGEGAGKHLGPGFLMRKNCFHGYTQFAREEVGSTTKTYEQFAAYNRVDASGDIFTDPLLANPGGGDFSLQSSSPCRWAGAGAAVAKDLAGAVFDLHHPDMGACSSGAYPTPEAPEAPEITSVESEGAEITATVDGDPGATNAVQLRRRSSGVLADEESRLGDGAVVLAAPAADAAYVLVPYSSVEGLRSKPGAPRLLYLGAGGSTANELAEALVERLESSGEVTSRLASSDAVYRRRPPLEAAFPCITYELAAAPDADAPVGKLSATVSIDLWGFERDALDELLEAVDSALSGERLSSTSWEVKHLRRLSAEPAQAEPVDAVTGRTLERVTTRWSMRAYRKG
jgi:hypothetical protein